MSAHDHDILRAKVLRWHLQYREDRDMTRYFSNCMATALSHWLEDQNVLRKRLGNKAFIVPMALSASSPILMAAIDIVVEELNCPLANRHTATEFMEHFAETVRNRYRSEYLTPAWKKAEPVISGLRSLGLIS